MLNDMSLKSRSKSWIITKIVKNIHQDGFAEIPPVLLSLNKPCCLIQEVNSTHYGGSNQLQLIFGSSHLRIQSSHLIFTFFADFHSSVFTRGRLGEIFSLHIHFAKKCVFTFFTLKKPIIFSLPKKTVMPPLCQLYSPIAWPVYHYLPKFFFGNLSQSPIC